MSEQQTPASVVERLRIDRAIGLEWPQSARDTVISSNVERYEAAALIERLNAENASLREALSRQCDNMAFVLNHMEVGQWYDKFRTELEQDRAALLAGERDGD